jgi:hypothetical protein
MLSLVEIWLIIDFRIVLLLAHSHSHAVHFVKHLMLWVRFMFRLLLSSV